MPIGPLLLQFPRKGNDLGNLGTGNGALGRFVPTVLPLASEAPLVMPSFAAVSRAFA